MDRYKRKGQLFRNDESFITFLSILLSIVTILSIIAIILSIISLAKSINNNSNNNNDNTNITCVNISFNCQEASFSPIYNPYSDIILDEDYYPYIIYDSLSFSGHGAFYKYKMWHQGPSGTLSISYSNDGISWLLSGVTNLQPGYHACVLYSQNKFNNTFINYYRIWYWTGSISTNINVIQTAGSDDGITWSNISSITQDVSFPLVDGISPGLFFHNYGPSFIYHNSNSTNITGSPYTFPYVLFYDIASEGFGPGTSSEAIGLAYSYDGFNFIRYGLLPVLIPAGSTGLFAWDQTHAFRPSLIIDSINSVYHLFYSASNDDIPDGLIYAHGI